MPFLKFWVMRVRIPLSIWDELKFRGIVANNLDEFITKAIEEKLEKE